MTLGRPLQTGGKEGRCGIMSYAGAGAKRRYQRLFLSFNRLPAFGSQALRFESRSSAGGPVLGDYPLTTRIERTDYESFR